MAGNLLCYGDNLSWLRKLKDEPVDLIYWTRPLTATTAIMFCLKTSGAARARRRSWPLRIPGSGTRSMQHS